MPSDLKGATRRRRSRTSLTNVRPSLPSHAANKDGKLNLEDDIDVPAGGEMILNKRSKAPTPTPADTTYLFGPTPTEENKPIGQWGIEKKKDSDAIKV